MELSTNLFIEQLLRLLPYWHYKIDKPFKLFLKDKMSLETYYCLQTLRQKGPMTMSEICRCLKISKQQATKMIDTLYTHHFVERQPGETDRRFISIRVTQQAIDYIESEIYRNPEFVDRLGRTLSAADFAQLQQAIETLLRLLPQLD